MVDRKKTIPAQRGGDRSDSEQTGDLPDVSLDLETRCLRRSLPRPLAIPASPPRPASATCWSRPPASCSTAARAREIVLNNIGDEPATYRISVEFRRMTAGRQARGRDRAHRRGESRGGHDRLCAAAGHPGAAPAAIDPHRRAAAARPGRRRISRSFAVPRNSAAKSGGSGQRRAAQGPASPADPDLRRDHSGHRPARQPPGQAPPSPTSHLEKKDGKPRGRARPQPPGSRSTFGEVRVFKAGVKDPIAMQKAVAIYTELSQRHVDNPGRCGLQGRRRRAGDGPVCRNLRRRHAEDSPKPKRFFAKARDRRKGICHRARRPTTGCARRSMSLAFCAGGVCRIGAGAQARRPGPPTPTSNSCSTSTSASSGSATACAPTTRRRALVSS